MIYEIGSERSRIV